MLNHIRTGGNRKYLELLEGFAARGHRVLVLFNAFLDYIPSYFTKIEIPLRYGGRFPPASYLFKQYLKKNIASLKETIRSLQEQYSPPDFLPSEADSWFVDYIVNFGDTHLNAAVYLKKALKTKLLYGVRCSDVDRAHILRRHGHMDLRRKVRSLLYEQLERSREKKAAKYANRITFLNNSDKSSFLKRTAYAEAKTAVIHNHIGPPGCTGEYKDTNNSRGVANIVYTGVLSADKGLFDLLQAAAILKARGYGELHYYLLGRLEDAEGARRLAQKLGIQDLLSFEGYRNPLPYFKKYDLFVYPTLYDAFGNVITEALHTGCPVIASAVGGVTEILQYRELLFTLGNPKEIAGKIEGCIENPGQYQRIRRLCKERAAHFYFDWIERYEQCIQTGMEWRSA
ncbi:MAG: glycosyltransferase family 4 protein [Spirochaetaceae bacterium]|jgi:glycosyltransferase involved in cell wall biosynthesis|nr:glycosyltransferase family 4 protein [Spirochaetaceae bacterium]